MIDKGDTTIKHSLRMPSSLVSYESVTSSQQNVTSEPKQYAAGFHNASVSENYRASLWKDI